MARQFVKFEDILFFWILGKFKIKFLSWYLMGKR